MLPALLGAAGRIGWSLCWCLRLKHPGFLALLVVHCSNNFAMYSIMSWGPSYFTEVLKLPLESVGLYLMLPAAFSGPRASTCCLFWFKNNAKDSAS